jgi:hypothetical protein
MEKCKGGVSSTMKSFFTGENKSYYSSVQNNVLYKSLKCQTFRTYRSRKLLMSALWFEKEFSIFEKGVSQNWWKWKGVYRTISLVF